MKRIFSGSVAAFVVLCAAVPAFALGFEMGWKSGLCLAKLSGNIADPEGDLPFELGNDFSWRNGFAGGVFFDFRLSDMISIQPEFIYMQKGAWIKDTPIEMYFGPDLITGAIDTEMRLWYFEMPILAKFTFFRDSFFSPFACAGPALSYRQRSIGELTVAFPGYFSYGVREDIAGEITKYDLGLVVGGGFDLDFGGFSVFFEGRYNYGLWNVDDSETGTELKNRAIAVLMGMSIPITE